MLIQLVLALGILVAGFSGGVKYHSGVIAQRDLAQQEATAKEAKNRFDRADKASSSYEKAKAIHVIKYQTITETVEKIVDRPVYRDTVCWDADGMRAIEAAISRDPSPSSQPTGAVPGPDKAK